jgi:hypothetical protein
MPRIQFRRWLLAAPLAVVALTILQPAAAATLESCVSAKISAPFWLPDGELHAPGNLTLCIVREFSPIANLHKLSVDGRTVGVFLSQKRVAEGTGGGAPEVIFERDAAGNLKLLGYSVPERDRVLAFRLPASTPARGAPALARVP